MSEGTARSSKTGVLSCVYTRVSNPWRLNLLLVVNRVHGCGLSQAGLQSGLGAFTSEARVCTQGKSGMNQD